MFSWDTAKARRNQEKHGFAFAEAATVFGDPWVLDWQDDVLLVVYTVRKVKSEKETVRIISARQASRKERKAYAG